jgi:DNA-binding NarL/FixJ family response regulator
VGAQTNVKTNPIPDGMQESRRPGESSMARVVIADDEPAVRHEIERLVGRRYEVAATAPDGESLLRAIAIHAPDIAIVDISMPVMNGIRATESITERFPATRAIILSVHDDPIYVDSAFAAGARGYVLKLSAGSELIPAIEEVLAGRAYLSSALRNGHNGHGS